MQEGVVEKVVSFDGRTERRLVRRSEQPSPPERIRLFSALLKRLSRRSHTLSPTQLRTLFALGRLPIDSDEWYVLRVQDSSHLSVRLAPDGVPIFLFALEEEEDFRLAWEAGCWFSVGMPLPVHSTRSEENRSPSETLYQIHPVTEKDASHRPV